MYLFTGWRVSELIQLEETLLKIHTLITSFSYSRSILTCGADGDIRRWIGGIDDEDPSSECVGEFAISIAQYDNRILVSTDLNTVQAYTFPDYDRDGREFEFKDIIPCIKVNKKYVAACSEDMEIKVCPIGKPQESFVLLGHQATVLSIDLSPNGILASLSGDGSIKIWNLSEQKEVKTIVNELSKTKSFRVEKSYKTLSFEPIKGKYLAYPKGQEIYFVETESWKQSFSLTDDNVSTKRFKKRHSLF